MSIVTKQGDKGKGRLLSGEEVSKADGRLEALGTLDELAANLGVARSMIEDRGLSGQIRELQLELLGLGKELAMAQPAKSGGVESISSRQVARIETHIKAIEDEIALPAGFVLPGSSQPSARLDVARAVARRLERRVVALRDEGLSINPQTLIYLNRLSDYLFLLARAVEKSTGLPIDAKKE